MAWLAWAEGKRAASEVLGRPPKSVAMPLGPDGESLATNAPSFYEYVEYQWRSSCFIGLIIRAVYANFAAWIRGSGGYPMVDFLKQRRLYVFDIKGEILTPKAK